MGKIPTFTVYLDKKCDECGQNGAYDNRLCGKCNLKAIRGLKMKTQTGREVAARFDRTARR